MIAVLAEKSECPIVREFFELFKTPWEFYRDGHKYDVLICSSNRIPASTAKLVVIYGSDKKVVDDANSFHIKSQNQTTILLSELGRLPIYGGYATFKPSAATLLQDETSGEPAAIVFGEKQIVRVGYDLFQEIRHLLTQGQPVVHARIPTLEMHIALLRNWITASSIPLVEIPPIPPGYNFMACLTHDVDHVGVRNHKFDHTMFGFLYRSTIGSVINFFQGRKSMRQIITNWLAALSLPFVHLGFVKDFWFQFGHYLKLEKGLASTFFFIPQRGDPGRKADGSTAAKRAAKYDVAELTDELRQLQSAGCEIGVHGIDAWRDDVKGRKEFACIAGLTGKSELGVRMHWLYFDEQSPVVLERAGFSYDSTVGFNGAVGYRAGTMQVFKPPQTERLLELPMHIMDTALFYPSHMNLSPKRAAAVVDDLMEKTAKFGGVLTINWHDRSIAPERLWDNFYVNLLDDLKKRGACFCTAAQTTSWFRTRRSVSFVVEGDTVRANVVANESDPLLPALRLRVYTPDVKDGFMEKIFTQSGEIKVPVGTDSELSETEIHP